MTNLEEIINELCFALESTIPDVRGEVRFKRWTGEDKLENASIELRERAFQFRLGKSLTPRTLSSLTSQWQRIELLLVVGYNFTEPRQKDSAYNLGLHSIAFADHRSFVNSLVMSNALRNVSGVKRLQLLDAETPSETSRVWRFDLEWSESF
jgi:hypothetical protein